MFTHLFKQQKSPFPIFAQPVLKRTFPVPLNRCVLPSSHGAINYIS